MTLEELKVEAEKQGYRLTKIIPTVKILPCPVCGAKRTIEWCSSRDGGGYIRECHNRDFKADFAKTKTEAKQKWNEAVLKYKGEN